MGLVGQEFFTGKFYDAVWPRRQETTKLQVGLTLRPIR